MSNKPDFYFTLLERRDNVWYPQYGSFDRADCVDEVQAYRDIGTKKKDLKIIKTYPLQVCVDAAVSLLNGG